MKNEKAQNNMPLNKKETAKKADGTPVSDPPVPNRAHTEMKNSQNNSKNCKNK